MKVLLLNQSTERGYHCVGNQNQVTIKTAIAREEFAVTQVGSKTNVTQGNKRL